MFRPLSVMCQHCLPYIDWGKTRIGSHKCKSLFFFHLLKIVNVYSFKSFRADVLESIQGLWLSKYTFIEKEFVGLRPNRWVASRKHSINRTHLKSNSFCEQYKWTGKERRVSPCFITMRIWGEEVRINHFFAHASCKCSTLVDYVVAS